MPQIERLVGGMELPERFRGCILALGNFDGVHAGHQAVVGRAVEMARAANVAAVVATFDPHPRRFFRPGDRPFRLTSLEQRQRLLATIGVDAMMVFDFGSALASIAPEDFVGQCLRGVGGVVTGTDFAFGRQRSGDIARLAALSAEQEIVCAAVTKVTSQDRDISSTRIRAALAEGNCAEAARLLTRPYTVQGTLDRGRRNDPDLPILDAAMDLGDYARPRGGVYAVRATLPDGRRFGGSAFLARGADDLVELFLVGLEPHDLHQSASVEFLVHLHDADGEFARPKLRRVIQTDRERGYAVACSA